MEKEIRNLYKESLESLELVENHIKNYGILDNGLSDSTESFEQGYVNAIECVCNILGIKLESEVE